MKCHLTMDKGCWQLEISRRSMSWNLKATDGVEKWDNKDKGSLHIWEWLASQDSWKGQGHWI